MVEVYNINKYFVTITYELCIHITVIDNKLALMVIFSDGHICHTTGLNL